MTFSVTTTAYKGKPTRKEYVSARYTTKDIDIAELCDLIHTGHSINAYYDFKKPWIFKGDGIKTNHYLGSYGIFIDCDHQSITLEEKLSQMTLKPTIWYRTFSDKDDDRRFRFVYIFDSLLTKNEYQSIFMYICDKESIMFDNNAKSPYQTFHGTDKDVFYNEDNVYKVDDFKQYINYSIILGPEEKAADNIASVADLEETFGNDFKNMSYSEFYAKYLTQCRNEEHSPFPIADEDTPIIELPDDFYEIYRLWHKDENASAIKIKNHHHRRSTLFNNLMIRRLICPDLSLEELVYALVYEMLFYIDNTDNNDMITKQHLYDIACNAYKTDISGFNYRKPRKSMVNPSYVSKYSKTKSQVRDVVNAEKHTSTKESNFQLISDFYDFNKTINDNIKYISEQTGIVLSDRTIRRWKKDNGYTRTYKRTTI